MDGRVMGFDVYNMADTGGVSMTITAKRSDPHHVPVVCIALEGNGARPSHSGGGWSEEGRMYTLNTIEQHAVCYSIGAMNSEGMLSDNPNAGIHIAEQARTIDASGANPSCYQGGGLDCYRQRNNRFSSSRNEPVNQGGQMDIDR